MASQSVISRGGENADHLPDMAAQLLVMLSAHGDGARGGRKAWDELQGKLAQVATCVSDSRITVEAQLQLLEDAKGSSSHLLSSPEADALLRQIMGSMEEESMRALDAGMAIPRLRELLLVVADQLDMVPLRDSDPVQMVDGESNFCDAEVARIIKCSPQLSTPNAPYAVVSIVGAQSTGKSYLLNRLFGTKFPEMNAKRGRRQTTKGIMMSRCIGPSLLVLDVEGFDGRERAQDTLFEKQAALFALTVSDVMLVNMSVFDIGREQAGGTLLFKTIFKERPKLPAGLTSILVVLRFYNGETPLEILKDDVMQSLEQMWMNVHNGSLKFEDYIEVNVIGLPDKDSEYFPKEVAVLRRLLSRTTLDHDGSAKVPASSFSVSSRRFWDQIKKNEKLDIPSHQEALAKLFCREIMENTIASVNSCEDYKRLKAEESPRCFEDISDNLLKSSVTKYDHETEKFDRNVRDVERGHMLENLGKVFMEDSRELIRKLLKNTSEQFKAECAHQLENMEQTDADLNHNVELVDSCVSEFKNSFKDLKVFDSVYLQLKCGELQTSLQSHIVYVILNIKEKRARKAAELAKERADANMEEMMQKFEDLAKQRQLAEVEMARTKDKQHKDEMEYTRKMHAEQQAYNEKMLAERKEETEKMFAVHQEQIGKILAAQDNKPVVNVHLLPPNCSVM